MKSSIIDSIKALPPLSTTIMEINKLSTDGSSTVHDMAKVIEKDPMIVANILKIANSPLYGFGKEIKNAAQAVTLFGMSMTRSIVIGNSIKKLLNVDMQPYNISSEEFARISSLQAALVFNWYKKVDRQKADDLYLGAFLQETGKILIASEVLQNDETISFASEIENSNNIAAVEKTYVNATSAEVTALVFKHWEFDTEFIDMIKYADTPSSAPDKARECATALNIVKTIVPMNKPFAEMSVNFGLKKAQDADYDVSILESVVKHVMQSSQE